MLIDEIISGLSDTIGSLTDALLKTKILLHQIGEQDLAEWLNNEINGYPVGSEVPDYRRIPSAVRANVSNGAWHAEGHPIPLMHLTEEQIMSVTQWLLRESVTELETLSRVNHIRREIPMEMNGILSRALANDFRVERAWCESNPSSIGAVLVQVRSRLLDFLLNVKDKIGDATSDAAIKDKATTFDAAGMFSRAMFGPNATIVIGVESTQSVTIRNGANDFESLTKTLRDLGIPNDEITSLGEAIAADKVEGEKPSLSSRVGGWIANITAKAAQGAINVSVDQVVGVVVKAVSAYLGIPTTT